MGKKQLFCRLVDGELEVPNEESGWANIFFAEMKKEYIVITIQEFKEDDYEVTKMRRYYFGVIVRLWREYTGYTSTEMDYLLRSLFLSYKLKLRNSGEKDIVRSLQDGVVDRTSMRNFIDDCITFSNSSDVRVPTPEQIKQDPKLIENLCKELRERGEKEDIDYFKQIFSH